MDRYQLSDAERAEIREQVPGLDPDQLSTFAHEFDAAIRAAAKRDGDVTESILRLTLPQAFGLAKHRKVPVDEAARQTGIEPATALWIMQSAIHEAGEAAHQRS